MKFFDFLRKPALFSFILLAFVFVGCKDDDDKTTPVDDNEIVGKWQLTKVEPEVAGTVIPALAYLPSVTCIYNLKFTFTNDNKVALSDCDAAVLLISNYIKIEDATTWKVTTGKLTLTNDKVTSDFGLVQNTNEMKIVVNTNTSGAGAAVNAVMTLKRL